MIKTISDSLTADSKTALAIAFTLGYLIEKILRNTVLKGYHAKSSEHIKDLDRNDFDDDSDDDDEDEEDEDEYGDEYVIQRREDYKMIFAINSELKMGKGKVAAQCAHAAIAAFKMAIKKNPAIVKCWSKSGQPKITLKVDNENQLMCIKQKAKSVDLIAEIIRDAGRTQIPAGSLTVCVIGPGPTRLIDEITGTLKLY